MSKYTVTHSCGHDQVHDLTVSSKLRQSRLDYLARVICWDCQRAAQLSDAEAKSTSLELPALEGSEKQIAWATQIRAGLLQPLRDRLDTDPFCGRTPYCDEFGDEITAAQEAVYAQYAAETSAKWWIEHRAPMTDSPLTPHARYSMAACLTEARAKGLLALNDAAKAAREAAAN